ncbi:metal ABC transporter substrate-binding protein [Sulfurovum mangrovi]|uniref:metal ABC transporter substrate-binding protein n=1 Tax=Sulfurovum mangrovi TaxID=2893889 RepID=UPI001E5C6302|nr:zinc ABC transporter substrate-binding protein [Sulfurovum mangrovi]UFH59748.1 zinc ABC transporter substrate-binding protein [Sulfurovum mangrovi]UFH60549.1 zinc ABC transporter substrate-binding protein [Sulfurovum mangrovi]
MRALWIILIFATSLFAKLQVAAAYPYIEQLTKEIAKDRVDVTLLSQGNWDPHFVVPKPSLISGLRDSDLLILNGASLEIGWLPPLIQRANNPRIQTGAKGYLDLSKYVELKDIPTHIDSTMGHVHKEGNPHFILDPHNIITLAEVIMIKLSVLDKENYSFYKKNFEVFKTRWTKKLKIYDRTMKQCEGIKVVQYHELFNYFLYRYQIKSLDNLEPLPGVKPNSKHTLELIKSIRQNGVKHILQDVYHEDKTASFIASKSGAKVITLPHDVGALKGTQTLEKFYDTLIGRICN